MQLRKKTAKPLQNFLPDKNDGQHQDKGEKATFLSPLVKRMLEYHKLNAAQITGTGTGGRITRQDVEAYLANPQLKIVVETQTETKSPGVFTDAVGQLIPPHTNTRRQIARHMVESKQTSPHVLTVMEVDMSRVLSHREANKAKYAEEGINLTLTAYFISAMVKALADHRTINATWTEEGIFIFNDINIGMAVAMGEGGLIVPVIKQAQNLSLKGLARAINDLAHRARNKKTKP